MGIRFADDKFEPFFQQSVKSVYTEIGSGRHLGVDALAPADKVAQVSPYVGVRHIRLDVSIGLLCRFKNVGCGFQEA